MMKQLRLFPIYCIDASALINLTKWYPRDIFPAIWEKLEGMVKRGELISHIEVYREIQIRKDEIYNWCKQNKKIFKDIDDCQQQKMHQIEKEYKSEYWETQMNKDGPWADPLLIALSVCEDATIITDEKNSPNHIPYIANTFQRQCLNLLDFFRKIGIEYKGKK